MVDGDLCDVFIPLDIAPPVSPFRRRVGDLLLGCSGEGGNTNFRIASDNCGRCSIGSIHGCDGDRDRDRAAAVVFACPIGISGGDGGGWSLPPIITSFASWPELP